MIQLPLEITKDGFTYVQMHRKDYKAIYARYKGKEIINYEVFYINVSVSCLMDHDLGKAEERELYPIEQYFGRTAWRDKKEKRALSKYKSLKELTK